MTTPRKKPTTRRASDSRTITLKNVPDQLYRRLRDRAERERRSINQQAMVALDYGLAAPERPDVMELVEAWRRQHGPIDPDLADAFENVRDPSPGRDFNFE